MDDSADSSDSAMNQGKTRKRLSNLKVKAKDKVKQLKNRSGHRGVDHMDADTHEALGNLDENPAFNPWKVQETLEEHHETVRSKVDKTETKLQHAVDAVVHPQKSARAKAAREAAQTISAAPSSRPTHKDEVELVDAEDRLHEAKENTTVDEVLRKDDARETDTEKYLDRVMELEEHRDQMKAGYAMTHVNRVRVVQDDKYPWPRWQDFMDVEVPTGKRKFDWKNYLGQALLYYYQSFGAMNIDETDEHPFEADVLRSNIEKLAMVSAPWQAWFMDIRSVYRWEDPARTTRWLLIYCLLWYTEHFVAFLVGWIIWATIRNKFIRASANEIRQSMKRVADSESAAWQLGELLDKHGQEDWLDEVGKTIGPGAQLALGDLADLLEILANFREWRSPKNTIGTLVLMFVHFLICLTNWDFASSYLYAVMGLMFFVCWPIQCLHPKYRHAASLVKLLIFNIPTNAQWAFGYLRRQALLGQLNVVDHEREGQDGINRPILKAGNVQQFDRRHGDFVIPAQEEGLTAVRGQEPVEYHEAYSSSDGESEYGSGSLSAVSKVLGSTPLVSFHADSEGKHGRLVVTAAGIHFQRSTSKRLAWTLPFDQLHEMRKLDSTPRMKTKLRALTKDKAVSAGDRLVLQDIEGNERILQLPKDRDECFNCIIGFSGLQWQRLQGGAAQLSRRDN